MTRQELRDYIRARLGHPHVVVELEDTNIDVAIDDALGNFNHYIYKGEPRVVANRAGSVVIPLQEGDRGVVACMLLFPQDTRVYAQMTIWEIMYRMVFPRMPLGDWYMLKNYYEQYQRIRGTDPDWYVDDSTQTLYVDCSSGPYDIFYVVARDLRIEDFVKLKPAYQRDLKDLALAEAKLILAEIRGKFGDSIPVPGGAMTTNASKLEADGNTVKAAITEKLEKIARLSISPITWG